VLKLRHNMPYKPALAEDLCVSVVKILNVVV
jgi:hypothetical protein